MGQETSSPIDESLPPKTLQERTLEAVATHIKEGHVKRIVVMVGLIPFGLVEIDYSFQDDFTNSDFIRAVLV